jgi:hypothetical protein
VEKVVVAMHQSKMHNEKQHRAKQAVNVAATAMLVPHLVVNVAGMVVNVVGIVDIVTQALLLVGKTLV